MLRFYLYVNSVSTCKEAAMLAPFFLNNITPVNPDSGTVPSQHFRLCAYVCVCVHEGTTVTAHILPLISIFRLFKKEKEKLLFMPRPS